MPLLLPAGGGEASRSREAWARSLVRGSGSWGACGSHASGAARPRRVAAALFRPSAAFPSLGFVLPYKFLFLFLFLFIFLGLLLLFLSSFTRFALIVTRRLASLTALFATSSQCHNVVGPVSSAT